MRIAFLSSTYPPQSMSGTALTIASLARRLVAAGHQVWVLVIGNASARPPAGSGETQERVIWNVDAAGGLHKIISDIDPDAIVGTGRKAPALDRRTPLRCLYLQDAFVNIEPILVQSYNRYIFASSFLREHYNKLGIDGPVVHPLVERDRYLGIAGSRGSVVSFGLSSVKRPDIVYELARRLPARQFSIFHTWGGKFRLRHLPLLLRRNVRLKSPVDDPQAIYGDARLILVPSDTEGWCRVVTEGQFAGIPTIGRAVAALPESIGTGGCLLPADASADQWALAVDRAFGDDEHYRRLSAAATEAGRRREILPDYIAGQWERLLGSGALHV